MMARRLKVLQLQTRYNVADSNSDLGVQILQGLPGNQFGIINGYLEGCPVDDRQVTEWREIYFNFTPKQMSGMRLGVRKVLTEFCQREQFDVVLLHRFKAVNLFMHINQTLRVPMCIGVSHGFGEYDRFYRRWQAKRMIDARWRFVGVSPAVRDYLIGLRCGFTSANTLAITNAIDISLAESHQLDRDAARAELGLPATGVLVGAIGRLVPVKGHIHLIRAFARIANEHPNASLGIIGGGREHDRLQAEIEKLGLSERVVLCGTVPDAMRYVRAFDLFVMPSLQEGLGLALLEGMCGRLPVLGSDIPAMRPLIDGAGGRAFPPGDEGAIAQALSDYLNMSHETRMTHGDKAYAYLCREHDINDFRVRYRRLIEGAHQ